MKSRNTRQKEILDNELREFKKFFSAEDLLEKVAKKDSKISIATIYRYLKECRKSNILYSYTCGGKTIYSTSKSNHCHFVCSQTGQVIHFEIDNLDFLKDKIPGDIESFQLEVKGTLK